MGAVCVVSGDFLLARGRVILLSIGVVGSASGAVFGSVWFFRTVLWRLGRNGFQSKNVKKVISGYE